MYSSESEETARDACVDVCPREDDCAADVMVDDAAASVDEVTRPADCSDVIADSDIGDAGEATPSACAEDSRFVDGAIHSDSVKDAVAGSDPEACVAAAVETPVIDSLPIESPAIESTPLDDVPDGTPVACEVSEATEVAEGIEATREESIEATRVDGVEGCEVECGSASPACECTAECAAAAECDPAGESAAACVAEPAGRPSGEAASAKSPRNQIDVDEGRFEMEEPKRPLMAVMAQGTSLAAHATARPGLQRMVSAKRSPAPPRPAAPTARTEPPAPRVVARPKKDDNDFDLGLGPSPAAPPEAGPPGREGYESQSGAGGKVLRGWRGLMNVFKPNQRAPKPRP